MKKTKFENASHINVEGQTDNDDAKTKKEEEAKETERANNGRK